MDNEQTITVTRSQLVSALARWDAQARAENWPDTPNPDASADHLISLLLNP